MKSYIDWAVQVMALSRKLRGCLSTAIRAWDRFNAHSRDICYLLDISDISGDKLVLNEITDIFENLKNHEDTLTSLDKSCEEYLKVVSWPFLSRIDLL